MQPTWSKAIVEEVLNDECVCISQIQLTSYAMLEVGECTNQNVFDLTCIVHVYEQCLGQ